MELSAKAQNALKRTTEPRKSTLPFHEWLDLLGRDENCPAQGLVDSNGKKSYGRYCFQMDTFISYSEKYGLAGPIYDDDLQRVLAAKMILDGGWRHWYTTVMKIGLPNI